jgi:hypothetical protein
LADGAAVVLIYVFPQIVTWLPAQMRGIEQRAATAEQVSAALSEQKRLRSQKLGEILVVRQLISPEDLDAAIDEQARMPMVRIGEALTALGFITEAQLEEALQQQQFRPQRAAGRTAGARGMVIAQPTCRPRWRARWATRWSTCCSFRPRPTRCAAALRRGQRAWWPCR